MPSQQQGQQVTTAPATTRWSPTPEQLMILEEMYRGGLRTPNASQIQQITAHLACYGRIEGKNVFYWFQNHKASDRQKLRRRLCSISHHHLLSCAQYYAAAAAHHHGHHGHGGGAFLAAAAAAPPPVVAPYQMLSLSSTSPTPAAAAAAAAAAAYGYYAYPATAAAFAAPPASRCGGNATPPSPTTTTQLFHYHQGGGGGGGLVPAAEALGRPEYSSSLGKLENFGVVLDDVVVSSASATVDVTMAPPEFEVALPPPPPPSAAFCRPLKTLDLFPGGLKEEQHDVA